jgi:ArsR family transcriptional regulator
MDAKNLAKYEARAKIVKAMAHPTRLFLVDELARNGERCNCRTDGNGRRRGVHRVPPLAILKNVGTAGGFNKGAQVYYWRRGVC